LAISKVIGEQWAEIAEDHAEVETMLRHIYLSSVPVSSVGACVALAAAFASSFFWAFSFAFSSLAFSRWARS